MDLLAQLAAFVALLSVFVLLLVLLREDPAPRPRGPVAAVEVEPEVVAPPLSAAIPLTPGPGAGSVFSGSELRSVIGECPPGHGAGPSANKGRAGGGAATSENTVSVLVTLLQGKKRPVRSVLVSARTRLRKLSPRRTQLQGDVVFEKLVPSESPLLLTVRDARWGRQHFAVHFTARSEDCVATFQLETPERVRLAGTLRGKDATPLRGSHLSVIDSQGTITELGEDTRFSDDGTFRVDVVPEEYRVRAKAPGFCSSDWERVTVGQQVADKVDFVLLRASSVSGPLASFSRGSSGRTADIELEAETPAGTVVTSHKVGTSSRGEYQLRDIRPGWYRMRACDDEREGPWTTAYVVEGMPLENFTLVLEGERRDPAVEGIVRDTAGTPLPEATVWGRGRRTVTDDYGHFILRLEQGDTACDVRIEKEGFEPVERSVNVEKSAGLEVTLEPLD